MQIDSIPHARCNVLGVHISAINMEEAVGLSDCYIQAGGRGYISVTGVHGVMEAQSDPSFLSILNSSLITAPDGMPTVWIGRVQGHPKMSRVYGPDFMLRMCELSLSRGYRHFFYGGSPGVAELQARSLSRRYPGLQIVGTYTPPFRALNASEEFQLVSQIESSRPDIVWVGLSTPKQERFMAQYSRKFNVSLMVGVGAAFDIHAGRIADAPAWMKNSGLQWLHRLAHEPRRLGRRYLVNNPRFIWNIALQLCGIRNFDHKF
jgi:N-acetylglucosaminyldiphosphoundecaprenol N-acetyl-beta-D-mannosaminyltransferase